MMTAFRKHWGSGEDGTVTTEHHTTGEKQRPKGIPLLALMASLLDEPQHQEMRHQHEIEDNANPNDIYNIIQQMAAAINE
jgi:hypothetical protein